MFVCHVLCSYSEKDLEKTEVETEYTTADREVQRVETSLSSAQGSLQRKQTEVKCTIFQVSFIWFR
jgi:hypothetical protein